MKKCKECERRIWPLSQTFGLLEICYPYEKANHIYHYPEDDMCYWCSILIYIPIESKILKLKGEFEKAKQTEDILGKRYRGDNPWAWNTNRYTKKNMDMSIKELKKNYHLEVIEG